MGRAKILLSNPGGGFCVCWSSLIPIPLAGAIVGATTKGGGKAVVVSSEFGKAVRPPHCPKTQMLPTIKAVLLLTIIKQAKIVTELKKEGLAPAALGPFRRSPSSSRRVAFSMMKHIIASSNLYQENVKQELHQAQKESQRLQDDVRLSARS